MMDLMCYLYSCHFLNNLLLYLIDWLRPLTSSLLSPITPLKVPWPFLQVPKTYLMHSYLS
jgi:hypothetical protein